MGNFFRVIADSNEIYGWHLKSPLLHSGEQLDPRIFTACRPYDGSGELILPIRRDGNQLDFNFCDFDMVVIKQSLTDYLLPIIGKSIQRIPVHLESAKDRYEILNVLDSKSCVDEDKSEFTKWQSEDGRPDKVGYYRMVTKLVINSEYLNGHNIFRIREWMNALIVSEDVKNLMIKLNATGLTFQKVT